MSDKKLSVWLCPHCQEIVGAHSSHPHWFGEEQGVRYFPAEEVEVMPVSAPNVLSVDEAKLLVNARDFGSKLNAKEYEAAGELCNRLEDWASKE